MSQRAKQTVEVLIEVYNSLFRSLAHQEVTERNRLLRY